MGPGVPSPLSPLSADRAGVGPSRVFLPAGPWPTLLDFLAERFPHVSRVAWQSRLARGDVRDARGTALPADAAYAPCQTISYYREVADEPEATEPPTVIHQDDDLLVLDKPHFQAVVPSGRYVRGTALAQARRLLGSDAVVPIHRLDRDTAGLVMFSLRPQTRAAYQALFREQRVRKVYEAVAPWRAGLHWPQVRSSRIGDGAHFMQRCEQPGPVNATTRVDLLAHDGTWGHYRLEPRSGQRHQLRVHLAALGLPIRHDPIYPQLAPVQVEDRARPLQLLAASLRFRDPISGREQRFRSRRRLAFAPGCGAD